MKVRRKILVIAEAANPEWVSVPLVGWSMASALRAVADVHIVTQVRNRDAFLRAGLVEGDDFTALDTEALAAPAYRLAEMLRGGGGKGWTMVTAIQSLTYPYFERLVWRRFGPAIRRGDFDVVHRITPLTPTTGSLIAVRCARAGVPFVLGPLNGGLPWPTQFNAERHKEREWLSYVRGAYKLLPNRRATLTAAKVIIVGSRQTASEIPRAYADRVVYMPENGIDPTRFARRAAAPAPGPLRLCFIGRLVAYKGLDMAITAALPLLASGQARLDVIGDGPLRDEVGALVSREGLEKAVTFHGWVDHARVQDIACANNVFLFPSIREFGGGAVLEAMALGLAPVVVAYGGPGELVAEQRGHAVPIGDRDSIVKDLRVVLTRYAERSADAYEDGERARAWSLAHLTWAAKADSMLDIYEWAVGARSDKPVPF